MSALPSPFTIPEPAFQFEEPPPLGPDSLGPIPFGVLLQNLRSFADYYVQASRHIEQVGTFDKPYHAAGRDAIVHQFREQFRAVKDIHRIRALTLARFGEELSVESAQRLLGEL